MNPSPDDFISIAKIGLAVVFVGLFIAVPLLLNRILGQLKAMNESLDVLRHNSIKADQRAEQ